MEWQQQQRFFHALLHLPVPEEEGEVLPDVGGANLGLGSPEELLQARRSELSKMEGFEVYTPVLESSVPQGSYWTTLRWVDVRKSTNELKSRLVAREFKGAAGGEERDDVFAATPVPASLRMLLLKVANDPRYVLRTADVTSAFLHAGLQGPRSTRGHLRSGRHQRGSKVLWCGKSRGAFTDSETAQGLRKITFARC